MPSTPYQPTAIRDGEAKRKEEIEEEERDGRDLYMWVRVLNISFFDFLFSFPQNELAGGRRHGPEKDKKKQNDQRLPKTKTGRRGFFFISLAFFRSFSLRWDFYGL